MVAKLMAKISANGDTSKLITFNHEKYHKKCELFYFETLLDSDDFSFFHSRMNTTVKSKGNHRNQITLQSICIMHYLELHQKMNNI